jgi:hypothetical protein
MQILANTIAYDPATNTIKGIVTIAPESEAGLINFAVAVPSFTMEQFQGKVNVKAKSALGPAGVIGIVWSAQILEGVVGDANLDGVVDNSDLGVMLAAFTAMDGAKVGMLLSNFGQIEKLVESVSGSMSGVGMMPGGCEFEKPVVKTAVTNGIVRMKATVSKETEVTFDFDLQL